MPQPLLAGRRECLAKLPIDSTAVEHLIERCFELSRILSGAVEHVEQVFEAYAEFDLDIVLAFVTCETKQS